MLFVELVMFFSFSFLSIADRRGFLRNPHSLPLASPHGDFFVIPTVCHGHLHRGFLRNPHSLPRASCTILCQCLLAQASLDRQTLSRSCGETGIRTPETLLEFTRFPGVPLQPLEHLSLLNYFYSKQPEIGLWHITDYKGTKNN